MNDFRNGTLTGAGAKSVDEGLRQYMLGVYNYMALGVGLSGLFSLFLAGNEQLVFAMSSGIGRFIPFGVILALGFFGPRVIFSGSKVAAHAIYWVYAAAWGVAIAPWLYAFQASGDSGLIYRAFFITATVFAGTSLFGYTTKKNLMGMGQFLFMACLGLIVALVVNIFLQSSMFSLLTSCAAVLIFAAVTAYETQMIRKMYQQGGGAANERSSILGAFMLYGSFATLFIHILNILGLARD